jgi:hypothetical protein
MRGSRTLKSTLKPTLKSRLSPAEAFLRKWKWLAAGLALAALAGAWAATHRIQAVSGLVRAVGCSMKRNRVF